MKTDNLIPYIAGIIDGEGHISMRSDNHGELIIIRMRSDKVLQMIKDKFGGSLTRSFDKKYNTSIFQFVIANKQANNFIKIIYPFLILKKENAKLCLKLRKIIEKFPKNKKIPKKDKLCEIIKRELKNLNKRNIKQAFK